MAAQIIKNARFCNLIDDYINWTDPNINPILRKGELGIVTGTTYGKTIGVIGNGIQNVSELLSNFDDNLIYFGKGAQYELLPAGTELGGVKDGNVQETAIQIKNGIVYNKLVDSWNINENCYTINKLEIKSLICTDMTYAPVFETDTIQVRYIDPNKVQEPTALADGKIAGVQVMNIIKNEEEKWVDGFFGLNNQGNFYIFKNNVPYTFYPSLNPITKDITGFYSINVEDHAFSIISPKKLTFINDYWAKGEPEDEGYEETKKQYYDSLEQELTINLTPPKIIVNEQNINYDVENNQYKITLDAEGLTEETAALINRIPELEQTIVNYDSEFKNIRETKLDPENVVIEGTNKLSVTKTTETVTVGENEEDQEERTKITFSVVHDEQTVDRTYVPENTISPGLSYTFITGIETDSYGHITKIITSTYKWN